ncbi:Ribosome biogenesis protein BMS1, partial [Tetrabaena socialis]
APGRPADEGEAMVRQLQATQQPVDEALARGRIRMFQGVGGGAGEGDSDSGDEGSGSEEGDEDEEMSGSEEGTDDEDGSDDEGEGEEDEDEGPVDPSKVLRRGMPRSAKASAAADGRMRRAAVFGEGSVPVQPQSDDEDDEDDEEDDEEGGTDVDSEGEEEEEEEEETAGGSARKRRRLADGRAALDERRGFKEDEEEEEEEEEAEGLGAAARWKAGMASRSFFAERSSDLAAFVYGKRSVAGAAGEEEDDEEEGLAGGSRRGRDGEGEGRGLGDIEDEEAEGAGGSEDSDDDFFRLKQRSDRSERAKAGSLEAVDALTCVPCSQVFGDFEDIEAGEKHAGDAVSDAARKAIGDARSEAVRLRAIKAAKKAAFDTAYDTKDGRGSKEEGGEEGGKGAGEDGEGEDGEGKDGKGKDGKPGKPGGRPKDEETYYDAIKKDMVARQAATRSLLDGLDPATRLAMEGHRPGAYVRLRFAGVPCELVTNHDPRRPLLVGGLGQGEEKLGMMRLRFKRHRWFPKLLKNRDPLIFSVGWRRFQSLPVYAGLNKEERKQR